jgi:hypothetical protein
MGDVERMRAPPLTVFAAFSLLLHAGAYAVVHRATVPAAQVFAPSTQTLAGDTMDIEPSPAEAPEPASEPTPTEPSTPVPPALTPGPAAAVASPAARSSQHPTSAAPAGGAPPAVFGAAGVRFATDLATTFTRGFPQAASADPVWSTVPFGSAGTSDVTLVIDEDGHLTGTTIGGSPSPALRRGIERTIALLKPRTFTARGAVTRLRVTARVGQDDVHDGLHGDVFALSGGSFTGDVGTAFFALPPSAGPGRRIDVELRLLP